LEYQKLFYTLKNQENDKNYWLNELENEPLSFNFPSFIQNDNNKKQEKQSINFDLQFNYVIILKTILEKKKKKFIYCFSSNI